jgi:hypothetical protein
MKYVLLLSLIFILSGCSHYYYSPNAHNVPLFKEKNEARLNIATSTGDEFRGTELQAAYSASNSIAVMANFINASGGQKDGTGNYGEGTLAEGGVGYFTPIAENFVFEVYGGAGFGKTSHRFEGGYDPLTGSSYPATGTADMKLVRGFIQPNLGFATDYFDVAFSARMCLLHFSDFSAANTSNISTDEFSNLGYISAHPTTYVVEPAITLRGGWKYIKVQTQFVVVSRMNKNYPMNTFAINLGMYMSFAPHFMGRK